MLSNRLYIISLHLIFFTYHVSTYVIISANVDDVNRMSRKSFVSWAERIANYVGKVVDSGKGKNLANNDKRSRQLKNATNKNGNENESPVLIKILSDNTFSQKADKGCKSSKEWKSNDDKNKATEEQCRCTKGAKQMEAREHPDGECHSMLRNNQKSIYRSLNKPAVKINAKSENDDSEMSLTSIEIAAHKSKKGDSQKKAHRKKHKVNDRDGIDIEDSTYPKLIIVHLPNISEKSSG